MNSPPRPRSIGWVIEPTDGSSPQAIILLSQCRCFVEAADEPIELNLGDDTPDPRPESQELLRRIKAALPQLEALYDDLDHEFEDRVYRYYHGSYKVYVLQAGTQKIVQALQSLYPGRPLNEAFSRILNEGTNRSSEGITGAERTAQERRILEAFFHARYFLEMAIRYGKSLDVAPSWARSGWASVLYLFNLR